MTPLARRAVGMALARAATSSRPGWVAVAMVLVALAVAACSQQDERAQVADAIAEQLGEIAKPAWEKENAEPWPDPATGVLAVRDHGSDIEMPAGVADVDVAVGGGRGHGDEDSAETVFGVVVEPTQGDPYCIHVALTSTGKAFGEVAINGDPDASCEDADSELMRRRDNLEDLDP